jgi:RecB family exonuclease
MIEFNEATHEYFNDGKKLISVTQLMRKHGLAPDYSMVNQAVLTAKAERGTLIHKEIEQFIKHSEVGFTSELNAFIECIWKNNIKVIQSETIAFNDIVAGTADLVLEDANGERIIADIKTTATLHKESVSWQLSIYAKLLEQYGCTRGQAFHFQPDGSLNVVEIPLKPVAEVERLLDCERNGVQFMSCLKVSEMALSELYSLEAYIEHCDLQKKQAEEKAKELRAMLLDEMEKQGVKTFENDRIRLTYIAPQTRSTIDSARLKKDLPEIAEKYQKQTSVKASLKITLKGEEQ